MVAFFGARKATCSTARFSVMFIFSPRNMASIRSAQVALLCELLEQLQASFSDPVLGVIQKQSCTFAR